VIDQPRLAFGKQAIELWMVYLYDTRNIEIGCRCDACFFRVRIAGTGIDQSRGKQYGLERFQGRKPEGVLERFQAQGKFDHSRWQGSYGRSEGYSVFRHIPPG
jgi:hypothetical protein